MALLLDVAHVAEAGLLERAPRAAVRLVDGRHDRSRLASGEDDSARELPQDLRAQAAAHRIGLTEEQVDARRLGLRTDQVTPVGVVGDAVGLDHPDRAPVLEDHGVLDVAPPLERSLALLDGDLDRVAPPLRNVLGPEPGLDLRQVGFLKRRNRITVAGDAARAAPAARARRAHGRRARRRLWRRAA